MIILCFVIISIKYFDGLNSLHFRVFQYLGIAIVIINSETCLRNAHLKKELLVKLVYREEWDKARKPACVQSVVDKYYKIFYKNYFIILGFVNILIQFNGFFLSYIAVQHLCIVNSI